MGNIKFAIEEINRYFTVMTGESHQIKLQIDKTLKNHIKEEKITSFDDVYSIDIVSGKGTISGINERSLLLGIYKVFELAGVVYNKPGQENEYLPKMKKENGGQSPSNVGYSASPRRWSLIVSVQENYVWPLFIDFCAILSTTDGASSFSHMPIMARAPLTTSRFRLCAAARIVCAQSLALMTFCSLMWLLPRAFPSPRGGPRILDHVLRWNQTANLEDKGHGKTQSTLGRIQGYGCT